MLKVGLTGSVASGKSTVARYWREAGVPVVSADELAREVVEPGSEGLDSVVRELGSGVLTPEGTLDREAVRARVFESEEERSRLEEILHPLIEARRRAWMEERRAEGATLVAAEIPLLFEVGLDDAFHRTVVVDADPRERLRRLLEDRGLEPGEARRIMDAQMDPAEKRARADFVLRNDGDRAELRERSLELLATLEAEAGRAGQAGEPARGPGHGPEAAGSGGTSMRLDLHMHTLASRDCLSDPEEVLARAMERGLDRIAITDHDRLGAALEMSRRHPERVICGEEVKTAEGVDVIGLYLEREIPGGTPAVETCRRIREQGGLVYLPHPFAPGKGGSGALTGELADELDVVEAFNARLHRPSLNRKAAEFARRHGLPVGAGSDAHTPDEVGRAWVEAPAHDNTPEGLLRALGSATVHGTESSRLVHLHSTWAKVRKKLPGATSLEDWKNGTGGVG